MSAARLPPQFGPSLRLKRDPASHEEPDKRDVIIHLDGRAYRMTAADWSRAVAQVAESPVTAIDPVSWRSTTT